MFPRTTTKNILAMVLIPLPISWGMPLFLMEFSIDNKYVSVKTLSLVTPDNEWIHFCGIALPEFIEI